MWPPPLLTGRDGCALCTAGTNAEPLMENKVAGSGRASAPASWPSAQSGRSLQSSQGNGPEEVSSAAPNAQSFQGLAGTAWKYEAPEGQMLALMVPSPHHLPMGPEARNPCVCVAHGFGAFGPHNLWLFGLCFAPSPWHGHIFVQFCLRLPFASQCSFHLFPCASPLQLLCSHRPQRCDPFAV